MSPNNASAERPIGDPFELDMGLFMKSGLVVPGELEEESGDDEDCPNSEYHTACNGSPGGVFGVFIPVSIGTSRLGELNPDGLGSNGV